MTGTNPTPEAALREQFERWLPRELFPHVQLERYAGGYRDRDTQNMWMAYLAAAVARPPAPHSGGFDPNLHVPGLWRCAKCSFVLVQSTLNAQDGTISTRNDTGDRCPNDDAPLWRVTWREHAETMAARCEEAISEAAELRHAAQQPDTLDARTVERAQRLIQSHDAKMAQAEGSDEKLAIHAAETLADPVVRASLKHCAPAARERAR